MADRMGWEGQMFYGTAGTTANQQITKAKDITITRDVEKGNTTVRGNSTEPPIETEQVTIRKLQIEITILKNSTDTILAALMAAAAAGTPVALRGKDYASGKGPDGDFTLSQSDPWPLNGEQVVTLTATPTRQAGREPQTYV